MKLQVRFLYWTNRKYRSILLASVIPSEKNAPYAKLQPDLMPAGPEEERPSPVGPGALHPLLA